MSGFLNHSHTCSGIRVLLCRRAILGRALVNAQVGGPLSAANSKNFLVLSITGFDAVDGAHSAASRCHKVVASNRTTLRGAVHGRG